jgi:TBC1 domain family member 24
LRLSVHQPDLLFTTDVNGTSISTLYNLLDQTEYCFIVIKTFDNEIFGAFCSANWSDRKQKKLYFGNGETFLFIIKPDKKCFKWIGTKGTKVDASQELFIRTDPKKISIGGGGHDGLSIDSNLTTGSTGRCHTFDNDELCSKENFQIACLEMIGFK